MGAVALTGNDTIRLANRLITDLGDGDAVMLDFPNQIVEVQKGKNGNAIYNFNSTGSIVNATFRVILGSADDKFFNGLLAAYKLDPPSFTLIRADFTKRSGDGDGNVTNTVYSMSGGIIQQYPSASENVEGGNDQAIAAWSVIFTNTERIQG